jgi:hypothetical protein
LTGSANILLAASACHATRCRSENTSSSSADILATVVGIAPLANWQARRVRSSQKSFLKKSI